MNYKISTKSQYFIIHVNGEIVPGCNANKKKEAIEFFEGMMGASFRFDNQKEYICKKIKIIEEHK